LEPEWLAGLEALAAARTEPPEERAEAEMEMVVVEMRLHLELMLQAE
jgi:hypothetical protein